MSEPLRRILSIEEENSLMAEIEQEKTKPTLIQFSSKHCAPCHRMTPIFEKIAAKHQAQSTFAWIDVSQAPALAKKLQVKMVPTFALFVQGQCQEIKVGSLTEENLLAWLTPHLNK